MTPVEAADTMKGVISQTDLNALFDCAKALDYEVKFYTVRDLSVPYVKKTPDGTWVYWNPLDPSRMDHFELLLRFNLKIEVFACDNSNDLLIRAYNETRRGHIGGVTQLVRQPEITPEQFCRALVHAVTQYHRGRIAKLAKTERHLEHERRRQANESKGASHAT